MVRQVLQVLAPRPGQSVIDLTIGTAGHALALARAIGPDGFLVGLDRDRAAIDLAQRRLQEGASCTFRLLHLPFSQAGQAAEELGREGFDVALADLGLGTHQLGDPSRGFSFDSEERLDMRFDTSQELTAWDVVNRTPEKDLADIFYELGQERLSRPIAARICREREKRPIESPAEMSRLVKKVAARRSSGRTWRIHPATRIFMSIRIFVNRELEELDALLVLLPQLLVPGGRSAILTYHSLEARRVKQAWRAQQKEGVLRVVEGTPLKPTPEETRQNRRARSAQLRAAIRL